jgi:hypothetical protein
LHDGKPEDKRNGGGLRDPLAAAKEMFDLLCTQDSKVMTEALGPEVPLEKLVKSFLHGSIEPIIALWSPQPGVVSVVEGSNQDAHSVAARANVDGAVDYKVGPDRLLFLDLRCRMKAQSGSQVRSYVIAAGDGIV